MRPLTRKLWRDLGRHRAQFIAVGVTIFLGVTMYAASYDSFQNLMASYEAAFTEFRFANLTLVGGDAEALAGAASEVSGVESVEARSVADVPLRVGEVKLLGRLVGAPADRPSQVNQLKVVDGEGLDPTIPDGVLVEEHMASHFDLEPGDTLDVHDGSAWRTVVVRGVVSSPEYIWPARSRNEVLASPDDFGVIFAGQTLAAEVAGPPSEAAFYFEDGAPDPALESELRAVGARYGAASGYNRDEQPSNAALSEDIRGFEEMAVFFPILFLSAAAMAAYVMISRLVYAQRPHIGVLLANGVTRRHVLRHYLGYGMVPGVLAAVPGAVAGVLLARVITRLYTGMLSVPVTLIEFYPATLIGGLAFGLLTAVAASLAPALVASRVVPAEAMRGETPAGTGRPSIIERVLPPVRKLPIRWRMALRGIERNPRRTVYTVIGVVLSLMLVLVSWGMIDTVEHLLGLQYQQIERQDAGVYFTSPVGESEVAALTGLDVVAAAEPVLELPVSLSSGGSDFATSLVALNSNTEMHAFYTPGGDWIDLPTDGLLLGVAARDTLGIEPGDEVVVTVADIGVTLADRVAGFVDEPLGTLAYTSRDHLAALTGVELPASSALIRYTAGTDAERARAVLTGLPEVAAFTDAQALFDMVQRYMVLFYAFVGVMLVFGAAMAFALIFNSMSVNIAERSREVATLLAVGTERRTISRLITAENLLVAIGGIPIGLVAGYFVSKAAMASFQSDMFSFDLYMRPTTFVWAALAIVVVALVSQWPGLRAVRRLSIPTIVKERSA